MTVHAGDTFRHHAAAGSAYQGTGAKPEAFVWDFSEGVFELRSYSRWDGDDSDIRIYRASPDDLRAGWSLVRENEPGQVLWEGE